ncbi:MAG: EAL domain-containing protein, partial [Clostridiales bacterium]|nr:EAL domain-containing protein [Clostridiales bacterium]
PGLTMNLNISTSQLKNPGFINMLSNAVSNADCKLMNLILDIPEEGLFTELPDIKEAIEKLSAKGVKMALDNFGRGYSSFNAIPLLPITVLKLDGNFTGNLASDANVRVLSASVISLMHDIDIKVCATGVGSDEQFRILAEQGCDIFQGKYLGPAMTLEEALDSIS